MNGPLMDGFVCVCGCVFVCVCVRVCACAPVSHNVSEVNFVF